MQDKPQQDARFYGRRKGRPLRVEKTRLLGALSPLQITLPLEAPLPKDLWLEIGFGGGEHLAQMAAQNPDLSFLGCDAFLNGVASLFQHIEHLKLANIRVYADDVRPLLEVMEDASLARVFILFPDPWPKKKHIKRRIVSPALVTQLARLVKPSGIVRLASDDAGYIEGMRANFGENPAFKEITHVRVRPQDWPPTRYEAKAQAKGTPCQYLEYVRL